MWSMLLASNSINEIPYPEKKNASTLLGLYETCMATFFMEEFFTDIGFLCVSRNCTQMFQNFSLLLQSCG